MLLLEHLVPRVVLRSNARDNMVNVVDHCVKHLELRHELIYCTPCEQLAIVLVTHMNSPSQQWLQ